MLRAVTIGMLRTKIGSFGKLPNKIRIFVNWDEV